MQYLRKYGVATNIRIPLLRAVGGYATNSHWTPAAGEVVVYKDGVLDGNIDTLPTFVTGSGGLWDFPISATEQTAADVQVMIIASALASDAFSIYNIPQHAIGGVKLTAATGNTITLPNVAPYNTWSADQAKGNVFIPHGGTGANQGGAAIIGYSGLVATLDRTTAITFDSSTVGYIYPGVIQGTDAASRIKSDLISIVGDTAEVNNIKTAFASTPPEVTSVPAATAPIWTRIAWMFAKSRNKIIQVGNVQTVRNDGDTGNIGVATGSDDGTTNVRGKFV